MTGNGDETKQNVGPTSYCELALNGSVMARLVVPIQAILDPFQGN